MMVIHINPPTANTGLLTAQPEADDVLLLCASCLHVGCVVLVGSAQIKVVCSVRDLDGYQGVGQGVENAAGRPRVQQTIARNTNIVLLLSAAGRGQLTDWED